MQSRQQRALLGLIGFALASCVSRSDIEEIKKDQKEILAKLDKVQRGGPQQPPGPQQQQRPQGPDPGKAYAFPVGNSPSKGPADALVTIVEVSDFQ